VVTYACETWVLKEKLLVFERKILRKMYGPFKKEITPGGSDETINYITLLVIEMF
jgi:hypothetical protein